MKNETGPEMKKVFLLMLLSAMQVFAKAQAIEINAGISSRSINYYALRFQAPSPGSIHLSSKLFVQNSHAGNLNYTGYGLDVLAEVSSSDGENIDHALVVRGGLGGTAQIDNEKQIYAGWPLSKRFNYGIVTEVGAAWALSEQFSLTGFVTQKFLFNKNLGSYFFAFGVGFQFQFN